MKKITSFLAMVMLCCISAFAQETVGTELPKDKLIKIGTAQMEVVAGQWYFLHNPRNPNQAADAFDLEGQIQSAGGLVTDKGDGASPILTATSVIDELTSEEGVNAAMAAKADIVVLCSSDDEYAEYAVPAFEAIGDKAIFIVAGAPACTEELQKAGIVNFINIKSNVLETRKALNAKLNI